VILAGGTAAPPFPGVAPPAAPPPSATHAKPCVLLVLFNSGASERARGVWSPPIERLSVKGVKVEMTR
jgi:hypothetical protein